VGASIRHDDISVPAAGGERPDETRVVYRITRTSTEDIGPGTRAIRVLVHYSRTKFFVASGEPRGYEHDLMKGFEAFYNKGKKKGETGVPVIFIPVRFDEMIPMLLAGRGDVAAGLLTMTGERARQVTFTLPYIRNVSEVIVAHAGAPAVARPDDLSGRKVHVLRGSSMAASLKALNERLAKARRPPVQVIEMPSSASTEDLLESERWLLSRWARARRRKSRSSAASARPKCAPASARAPTRSWSAIDDGGYTQVESRDGASFRIGDRVRVQGIQLELLAP